MRLRAFFTWRIAAIRRRVARSRRYDKLDWTPDTVIGFLFACVQTYVMGASEPGIVFAISVVLLAASVLYIVFALTVQLLAYGEWGDRVYDTITRKSLSAEYQDTNSATGSKRRRRRRTRKS